MVLDSLHMEVLSYMIQKYYKNLTKLNITLNWTRITEKS